MVFSLQSRRLTTPLFTTMTFLNNVQFKWGRTEFFTSTVEYKHGDHVMIEAENKGLDLGAVVSCEEVVNSDERLNGVRSIYRFATTAESEYWEGAIVEREINARMVANKILPENSTNIRVMHTSYTFDSSRLYLHYEPSGGKINLSPYMSDLAKAFPEAEVKMIVIETEKTTPTPTPFPHHTTSVFGSVCECSDCNSKYSRPSIPKRPYHTRMSSGDSQASMMSQMYTTASSSGDYDCDMGHNRSHGHCRVVSSDSSYSNWSDFDYDMNDKVSPAFYTQRVPPPTAYY